MLNEQGKATRWRFRFFHLFALVTFVAVILWASKHLDFVIIFDGHGNQDNGTYSCFVVAWDDVELIGWESFPGVANSDPTQPYPQTR